MTSSAVEHHVNADVAAMFVHRVVVKHFRSIRACDVQLHPLTILVGPNGAGKSNFVDAMRFVSDALRTTLDQAIHVRGGIDAVRHRSHRREGAIGIRLEFRLPSGASGFYSVEIGVGLDSSYRVQRERCVVTATNSQMLTAEFDIVDGEVRTLQFGDDGGAAKTVQNGHGLLAGYFPPVTSDRLYLVTLSGLPVFDQVFAALSSMGFYNLVPYRIRDLQPLGAGRRLESDGSNIASVLANLEQRSPATKHRIEEYLGSIVPGILSVDRRTLGPMETVRFVQISADPDLHWSFLAANMSDGTLRALGVLVALFQSADSTARDAVRFVAIEEPELALHPAAANVLLDSLRDASRHTQVLITSHSPDLLDADDLDPDSILAVMQRDGATRIGPVNAAARSVLIEHLFTGGELLRLDQLSPADTTGARAERAASNLFALQLPA